MKLWKIGLFVLVFGILAIGRIAICKTGFLNDTDEVTYLFIISRFDDFASLNPNVWAQATNDVQAQPPEIIIRFLEAELIQKTFQISPLELSKPAYLFYIGLFNTIVSLLILFLFYKIVRLLSFQFCLSLLGTLILGTLLNMTLYVRHILPYDHALLFHLLSLYILIRYRTNPKIILISGVISAIALTTYFGLFIFSFITFFYLIFTNKLEWKNFFQYSILFFTPFFLIILLYQYLTVLGDYNYLKFLKFYRTTITHGSFDEGLSFIFKYLWQVEGLWGLILLIISLIGVLTPLLFTIPIKNKTLIYLSFIFYLLFGIYIITFKNMVFFGRVLHLYYPFIVLSIITFISQMHIKLQYILIGVFSILSISHFYTKINEVNKLAYPRSAIYEQNIFSNDSVHYHYFYELKVGMPYDKRSYLLVDSFSTKSLQKGNYELVNFGFFNHFPDDFMSSYSPFQKQNNSQALFSGLHFQSYPFYTFEYCSKEGRAFYINKKLQIQILRNNL